MYKVCADGAPLWRSDIDNAEMDILAPKLNLDVNGAGSLSFIMPPGNLLYNSIKKLKSIITVEEDGDIIFRGRVMEDTRDFYNQKSVYCEGDRSFLIDSLKKPYSYNGNVQAFFRELVSEHNGQVDAEKRFTVGTISAVDETLTMEAEDDSYQSTSDAIENRLLGVYGGYLATRTAGGVTYLDWLKEPSGADAREISFSVNLLELKDKLDAADIFTVLLPLGAADMDDSGNEQEPVSVASVNGGAAYIQDDDAVGLYGKIWRAQTWSNEKDPSALLTKAREFLKTGALLRTITLTAVDMHFIDGTAAGIHIGDKVHILSNPHGMDLTMACARMEMDLLNPENTTYTFGEPPRTLTENYVKTDEAVETVTGRKGGGGGQKKTEAKLRWAIIEANEKTAQINLLTHDQNELTGRVSNAEIRLDGIDASITLKADRTLVDELETRITSAEIDIDGMNAAIKLKADANVVDSLGTRVTGAEVAIDGMNAAIKLKADANVVDSLGTRVTGAEVAIDGMNANIKLKADATVTDELGTRLSSAEITLDGLNSEIELKADKITLNGYVTANQMKTEFSNFESGISDNLYVRALSASNFECSSLTVAGSGLSLVQKTVVTGVSRTKRSAKGPSGTTNIEFYECSGVSTEKMYYVSWG